VAGIAAIKAGCSDRVSNVRVAIAVVSMRVRKVANESRSAIGALNDSDRRVRESRSRIRNRVGFPSRTTSQGPIGGRA
jgi:hypothetical protein